MHRALVLLLLAGCEGHVVFHGTVRVSEDVAPTEPAPILLLINDDYRYPSEPIDGMWGTREGGVHVIEPSAELDPERGYSGDVVYAPGVLDRSYWRGEYAYYPSHVYLGAFLDLDADGAPGAGEPWGAHPANPIRDLPFNTPDDDPLIVDIVIDRVF